MDVFDREYYDEDIRVVLSKILEQNNGLRADFRPDVKGMVSFNFRDMPLQAAFNKIVEENNLEYVFDPKSKIVTFSAPQPGRLITLTHATPEQLGTAKDRLRIGGELLPDPTSGVVMVRGSADQIKRIEELAAVLDKREQARAEDQRKDIASAVSVGTEDAKRRAAEAEALEKELQAQIRNSLLTDLRNTQTKIISIKYASVGQTSQTFQGQSVTLPGIDETLRSMLGLGDASAAAAAPGAQPAPSAAEQQELARLRRELGQVPPVITTDQRTNSVIVRGTPAAIAEVENLIARLDRPVPLIEIEVMIVRADSGVSEQLGVRWGGGTALKVGRNGRISGGITTGIDNDLLQSPRNGLDTTSVNNEQNNINPFSLLPTTSGSTLAAFVFRGNDLSLQAQLEALASDNKAQTISAPRVTTLNNLEAKVTNDRSRYLPTTAGANSSGTYQKVDAGLALRITPSLIQRDDTGDQPLIRLNINAQDKNVTATTAGAAVSGNEVQTQVVIPSGATFVMGGLMNDTREETNDKVPGLGDIPLLGALFSTRGSAQALSETIFFITPRMVMPNDEFAQDIAQRRYLQTQRAKLAGLRQDIQGKSQLINLNTVLIEEDE